MKKILLFISLVFIGSSAFAQLEQPVTWSYKAKRTSKTEAILYLKATMSEKWHIYSLHVKGIPAKTTFTFTPSKDFVLLGQTIEPKPISKYDQILKTNLTYFEKEVTFTQKVKLNKSTTTIKGMVEFMACNDKQCLPSDAISFSIPIK
ncbi:protein-disulfide reductase DsbD domain-containing protein [Pedobacter sp. Hv1]|uniref:protein-disulfide reductase DsbD domain-containing protein n=1 Tax=Pedobacter sp. Hv1 TaxID=1740090 RepID=UPI0006D8AB5B|nr:protein-disulfide reductase DsbD domain-containing protein [Pedobacter sp. Hv1]KQB99137.1 sugar transporter [Pedobacter sp. Hv1]